MPTDEISNAQNLKCTHFRKQNVSSILNQTLLNIALISFTIQLNILINSNHENNLLRNVCYRDFSYLNLDNYRLLDDGTVLIWRRKNSLYFILLNVLY